MAEPDSSLSPEKKLLKLIEEPQTSAAKPSSEAAAKAGPQINFASLFSPSALKGKVAHVKDRVLLLLKNSKDPVNVKKVNRMITGITVGLAVYLGCAIMYEISVAYKDYNSEFKIAPKEMADIPMAESRKINPDLFEEVQKRNIFISQEKRTVAEAPDKESGSLKLVEITKDLKLTGISINPGDAARTFCMIEDLKKNVTSFLKIGDTISGLQVEQINPDGVVLKHQKESIELR